VPWFVSANLHVNFERTQVVNYAQWKIAARRPRPRAKTIGSRAKRKLSGPEVETAAASVTSSTLADLR
jgi:hypothetical protein